MDIALVADKGGVGKTTLSYHIATRLRQLGHDVGLIDLDHRAASSSWVSDAEAPFFAAYPYDQLVSGPPEHAVRIWDTPAHPNADLLRSLAAGCELLLIIAEPDLESQRAAAEMWFELDRIGCRRVRLLLNNVSPTGNEGANALSNARGAGLPTMETVVRRYQCYQHCRWDGRAVCDYPYSSADKAWSDICALVGECLAIVEDNHAA